MKMLFFLLIVLAGSAFWAVMTNILLRAAIGLALTSVVLTLIMFRLNAPLAAVFELSVCAGLIPVIFISVISLTHRLPYKEYQQRRASRINRFWPLPFILLAAAVMLAFAIALPLGFNLPYPQIVNDVRTVFWNFRRFDLFGQIVALLAGAYGVRLLFERREEQ
jgi:NADH-quinone oxidoreductase subunit J